jgi:hypothetical protein
MATINFTKVSGVISVTSGGVTKSFFGARGSFTENGAGDGFDIMIGDAPFSVSLSNLRVNGQAPTTMSSGMTLLSAVLQ